MSSARGDLLPDSIDRDLAVARAGSAEALGRLLQVSRPYLLLVANQELPPELRGKVGGSDLVQETFLEAQRDFAQFEGTSEADLLAWLRRILLNNIANVSRHYQTDKRQVSREVQREGPAACDLCQNVEAEGASPSSEMAAQEQDLALRRALDQLSEPLRQVVQWRNYERLSFEEIGQRLGRSAEAARKMWGRAIVQLQRMLESPDASG